jgi:hypothetical protein
VNKSCPYCGQNNSSNAVQCERCNESLFVAEPLGDGDAMDRILKKVNSLNRLYSDGGAGGAGNASGAGSATAGDILLKERIELNTKSGRYIKCNNCNRLSPDQKFCMYCFFELDQNAAGIDGAGGKDTVGSARARGDDTGGGMSAVPRSAHQQIPPARRFVPKAVVMEPAVKSYKDDVRGGAPVPVPVSVPVVPQNLTTVKRVRTNNGLSVSLTDYSKARKKIDDAFTVSAINYEAFGLSEEQYNLKFIPPKAQQGKGLFDFSVSERFNTAYKKYEKPLDTADNSEIARLADEMHTAVKMPPAATETAFKGEFIKASVVEKVESSVTEKTAPETGEFGGIGGVDAEAAFETKIAGNQNIYTIKRQSERFSLTLLGAIGLLAAAGVMSSLFLNIFDANSGLNIVSLMPKTLGLEISNGFVSLAAGSAAMLMVSALYLLVLTLNVYMISSYAIRLALNKKINTYGIFIASFTCLLSNILILFGLMIGGVILGDLRIGFNIFFTAAVINFICSVAQFVSDK